MKYSVSKFWVKWRITITRKSSNLTKSFLFPVHHPLVLINIQLRDDLEGVDQLENRIQFLRLHPALDLNLLETIVGFVFVDYRVHLYYVSVWPVECVALDSVNSAVARDDLDVFDGHLGQNIGYELDRSLVCLGFPGGRPDYDEGVLQIGVLRLETLDHQSVHALKEGLALRSLALHLLHLRLWEGCLQALHELLRIVPQRRSAVLQLDIRLRIWLNHSAHYVLRDALV